MYPVLAGWNDTDLELDNPKANQDIFPGLCPPDPFDVGQISKLDVYLCVEYIYIYILSK